MAGLSSRVWGSPYGVANLWPVERYLNGFFAIMSGH